MDPRKEMHPIIHGLEPSQEQIEPILSRGQDLVVTAGAGTGKTRTLVARYLGLLADGIPLRSIAAITFTQKAAREMRNRVREEVRSYLGEANLSSEERQTWRSVYEELDAARISTIHSLAGEILRQHPAELGLDPGFETLDEGQAAALKALAIEAALAWAGSDKQASGLFPVFGSWKLRRILGSLLNKRLDVRSAFTEAPAQYWPLWQTHLVAPLEEFIHDPLVRAGLDGLASLKEDGTLDRAQAAGDLLADDLRIVIQCWEEIQALLVSNDWTQISRALGSLGQHLKQKGRASNWEPAKPKAIIKEIQVLYQEKIGRSEIDLAVDQKLAEEVIPALRALFLYADGWYAEARAGKNGLDFDDLEERILDLFKSYPEVLQYWQKEIQAILVDEYQDTNSRQRELVNTLNGEGNRLFLVGDGKQSIYRFRGADVAVFREERLRIEAQGESYQLDRSYRAHRDLLANTNQLLAPVLGEGDDLPYLEPFAPLAPGRESGPRLELPAYIEFHLAAGGKTAGGGRRAAEAVASRLLDLVGSGESAGGLNYGDVAVLCRASSSFNDFERAFEAAGIPFTTVSGQGFYDRPEVRDVLNALGVFADPTNDLALAGLLRSPVIGVPDSILLDVRDHQRREGMATLLDSARHLAYCGPEEQRPLLRKCVDLVDEFSALAGRVTAAELLGRFLGRTFYQAGLLLAGQDRAAGNLRKLVQDAQMSGVVSLADFLSAVVEIRNIDIREGEAQTIVQGAVQIMTAHQAKGLEFPVVVLGDAAKRDRLTREILIDERFGLVPPFSTQYLEPGPDGLSLIQSGKSSAYEIALEEERLKEDAEARRLLYVAATRAQDLLIFSGAVGNPTRDGKLPRLGGWMGLALEPLGIQDRSPKLDPEGTEIHRELIETGGLKAALAIYENGVRFDLNHHARRVENGPESTPLDLEIWDKLARGIESERPAELDLKPIYPASQAGAASRIPSRVVGEVVHKALELWKFPDSGESEFLRWIEAEFRTKGTYQAAAVRTGYQRVREILERFCVSDLFYRMDQSQTLLREVPYQRLGENNRLLTGSIDALFKEGGGWVLVEFKTDKIETEKQAQKAEKEHLEQVEGYLDAAERILGKRPEPILCFLDHNGRVKLITDRWG